MARILDGASLAKTLRNEYRAQVDAIVNSGGIRPGLAVIIVGDNPASRVYVRNKIRACEEAGLESRLIELAADASEAQLLAQIETLNADPSIHGILAQLPMPGHIDGSRVIEAIAPHKDVDGFHVASAGALMTGLPGFAPCTPKGVMVLLEREGIALEGKHAVVIGRSNIVGKPMAMLLLQAGATVTICHSKTQNLAAVTRQADVLVAAIGRARFVTAEMVKSGACVIDVGINRLEDGKLAGDVDFEAVSAVASTITPVPGGVGPMTIAMLLANTLTAATRRNP
jgi:methylenetetrahydrofolate dehydrogenase (NADP+) / methenyltetrahydrofolate cyclohydrolase